MPTPAKINPHSILPGDQIIAYCTPIRGFPYAEYTFIIERQTPTSLVAKAVLPNTPVATYLVYLKTNIEAKVFMEFTIAPTNAPSIGYIGRDLDPIPCRLIRSLKTRLGDYLLDDIWIGNLKFKAQRCNPGECIVQGCTRTLAYPIGPKCLICWLHAMELFPQLTTRLDTEGESDEL